MTVERRPKAADLNILSKVSDFGLRDHHDHSRHQYHELAGSIMETRGGGGGGSGNLRRSTGTSIIPKKIMTMNGSPLIVKVDGDGKKTEYMRSLSLHQGGGGRRRIFSASYLSLEGLFLLVCLTVSLLLLPLILPPLPPPPSMLLLLPICILALLMILAFMPASSSNTSAREVSSYAYL